MIKEPISKTTKNGKWWTNEFYFSLMQIYTQFQGFSDSCLFISLCLFFIFYLVVVHYYAFLFIYEFILIDNNIGVTTRLGFVFERLSTADVQYIS